MNDLSTLLTDEEIEYLDRFLLDRIDDDADTQGKDEGILDVADLDGLLTAVVSGPTTIQPSKWLPAVWGDFEPVWESEKEFKEIFMLMIRHMNAISVTLMEHPGDFEPIFLERVVEGKSYTIVDEWCEGYCRGVGLAREQWNVDVLEMKVLLAPILAFTAETSWQGHDHSHDGVVNIQNAIAPNVREIHAYWLERRSDAVPTTSPVRRSEPRVGRNEPCPCGSGKKYKKCCLH